MKLSRTVWSRCTISNERDLRPRINQNPKFAPRSETDEDPRCFHMGVLPPTIGVTCLHLSIFCKKAGCCNVTNDDATKIAKQT